MSTSVCQESKGDGVWRFQKGATLLVYELNALSSCRIGMVTSEAPCHGRVFGVGGEQLQKDP